MDTPIRLVVHTLTAVKCAEGKKWQQFVSRPMVLRGYLPVPSFLAGWLQRLLTRATVEVCRVARLGTTGAEDHRPSQETLHYSRDIWVIPSEGSQRLAPELF